MRNTLKIRSIFFVALLSIGLFTSCKKEIPYDGYIVSGTVKGMDDGYITMSEYTFNNQNEARVIDSVAVIDGSFELKGKVDFPDMVELQLGKYSSRFMLENSPIKLTIDVSELTERATSVDAEVVGSKSQDEYDAFQKENRAIFTKEKYKPIDELRDLFAEAKKTKIPADMEKAEKQQEKLGPLMEERMNESNTHRYDFIRKHPSSPVSVHAMSVYYTEGRMSRELLKEFYDVFQGDARKTGFFKNFITKIYKDNFENVGVGNTAPDFTLNTVDGEEFTLSNVEGKYILVDFWASWCVPCRASFPHLKELRKEYGAKGFTIVGVGTADKEDAWRKAIKVDQTPWIHVYDVNEGFYGPVAVSYGVPHLSTTLLLDSDRKIVLRNPTKEELDTKLAELFNK